MKQPVELRSKLIDGLLAGSVLVLLELLLILMFKPVLQIFGRPGLLIYTVVLIAVGGMCLEQSLSSQKEELYQAWWGTLGGMVGWVVIELSNWLGGQALIGQTGIFSLLFIIVIIIALWRHTQLPGFRYFVLLTLLGWSAHVAIEGLRVLASLAPQLSLSITLVGYLAAAGMMLALVYNFLFTRSRQERLDAAIMAWFAVMVMIYTFRGGFI